jgi:hypothetical protein
LINCVQQAVWQHGEVTDIFSTFSSYTAFISSRRITPVNGINNDLFYKFNGSYRPTVFTINIAML